MNRVLITGASSGIGLQLAKDYVSNGWDVIACGRDKAKLENALSAYFCQKRVFDTTDKAQVFEACADLAELDLIILNAGTCQYIDDPIHFDSGRFEEVVRSNLIGTAYCLEALLPKLNIGGHLAFMSSTATMLPFPRAEAYGASKAGVDYLAESLAIDLLPHNISVSNIKPCFVETPLTDKNKFAMPGRISVVNASRYIRHGLAKRKAVIAFTPLFVLALTILQWLPRRWWQKLQHRT